MKKRPSLSLAAWCLCGLLAACGGDSPSTAPPAAAVVVEVSTVEAARIQDVLALDGMVAPSRSVDLMARVAGVLEAVHFKDGDAVRRGQLLFSIEDAGYVEQVKLNQARLDQSRSDYRRQVALLKENASSQASVDVALSNLRQAEANLRLAQISLGYTQIRAPFDGVMGRHLVDAGNYVGATSGGTTLGTAMQISPAYVNAAIGERDALRLREKAVAAGRSAAARERGDVAVRVKLQNEDEASESGVLDFIDRQLAQGTGTIAVRGRFANERRHLVPGFYARLIIDLGEPRSAVLIPRTAVLGDQQGEFVYVVDEARIARRRAVSTVAASDERREIVRGLAAGERLVVLGQAKLGDGQAVLFGPAGRSGVTQ
ncbi:MAG: efflux RND transporter periplasmic adaptor subunit [Methylibium sp.]|uniref:efflux RND transporter periplasmic adaptor subunit n=1 Tax=Methylibium sp. TaxID=2067992 RepID=UPI00179D0D5A|nr:efflux RND transporter periplasmic adaptor subunit [Methylibium sp.]MBA2723510.1 efflux RND transporter periplasmic adaptor subunit [Methylibium sp.]MBA3589559.1 efflux RND transporter periplasmic adaptor subunit [Methylibium sp.]